MENNTEFARLKAENIGLNLKIKDLESILRRRQERFDTLHEAYIGIKLAFDRARSLLEGYAECPGETGLGKLDRKLSLFFPDILQAVKINRGKRDKVKVTIVNGSLYSKENRDGA